MGYGLSWAPGNIFLSSDIKNDESLIQVLAMYIMYIALEYLWWRRPKKYLKVL